MEITDFVFLYLTFPVRRVLLMRADGSDTIVQVPLRVSEGGLPVCYTLHIIYQIKKNLSN